MEGGVNAEHNAIGAYGFVGLGNLAAHGHTAHFQIQVGVAFGHLNGGVDIHPVSVAHVDHGYRHIRVLLSQQGNAPRQRIRRVAAVDKHRDLVLPGKVHYRVHHRIVSHKAVKQGLHFNAHKALVAHIVVQLLRYIVQQGIDPYKGHDLVRVFVERLGHRVVVPEGRAGEKGLFNFVLVHLLQQLLCGKGHTGPAAKGTDMRMCVYLLHAALASLPAPPAIRCNLAPAPLLVKITTSTPATAMPTAVWIASSGRVVSA